MIVQAYKDGYSQHMIATLLAITQQAVLAVIKRSSCYLTLWIILAQISYLIYGKDPFFWGRFVLVGE